MFSIEEPQKNWKIENLKPHSIPIALKYEIFSGKFNKICARLVN